MTSTGSKRIYHIQQAIDKQVVKEKFRKCGKLISLIRSKNKLSEQIDKSLIQHAERYKLNGPAKILETASSTTAYEEAKEKLEKMKLSKFDKNHQRTAKIRAHHLTKFLTDYIINLFQSGYIGNEIQNKYPAFQISRLLLTADLVKLQIFWLTLPDMKANDDLEKNFLPKLATQIRHDIVSNRVIGYVPPIVFSRDNSKLILDQIEELFNITEKDVKNKSKIDPSVNNTNDEQQQTETKPEVTEKKK